jgi:hypothetical protein
MRRRQRCELQALLSFHHSSTLRRVGLDNIRCRQPEAFEAFERLAGSCRSGQRDGSIPLAGQYAICAKVVAPGTFCRSFGDIRRHGAVAPCQPGRNLSRQADIGRIRAPTGKPYRR